MNVIIVDDERIVLLAEEDTVKTVLPNAIIHSFQKSREAIDYADHNKVDIAFLDISMKGMTGLELAQKLQTFNPKINIIFCTGYSEYSLDALNLYCSAYLMKPITEEKLTVALSKLRYEVSNKIEGLKVQCFGNFEVYFNGIPVGFKHKKTKELFAYLIDRKGATVSTKEIVSVLYDDGNQESYVRNLRVDLKNTFESLGIADALIRDRGNLGVNAEKIQCDYYEYLDGKKLLFNGEYMSQYSFAEETLGWLICNK